MVPFIIFSVIQALNYTRNELIPNLAADSPLQQSVSKRIADIVQTYHQPSLAVVASFEAWVIMPMTVVSVFWGRLSLFTPLIFAQFLSFRFAFSPLTKQVLRSMETTFDGLFDKPSIPPWAKTGYGKVKEMIHQYGDIEARSKEYANQQTQATQ